MLAEFVLGNIKERDMLLKSRHGWKYNTINTSDEISHDSIRHYTPNSKWIHRATQFYCCQNKSTVQIIGQHLYIGLQLQIQLF
jgi:hypothetical protein